MKKMSLAMAAIVLLFFLVGVRCAPAKSALEVVVLGSGGPRPFGRAGSSYIVLLDGTPRILVDAGPGAFLRIGELNLDLDNVDTVLLTHLHIDHSGDLAAFFNARALSADGPIVYHIFGPDSAGLFPKTSRFVDLLVGKGGAFEYQKTTLAMTVTDATAGKNFSTSWAVNIPAIVGANTAYVGFTGGTGGLSASQKIETWTFASTPPTSAVNFSGGFTSTTGLQLNGSTTWKQSAALLTLTNGGTSEAGSAFYTTPVNIQAFTNDFSFQLTDALADGFTFTIQDAGPTALGPNGGSLGYGTAMGASIAVKFDLYSNAGEGTDSTGEYSDGAKPTVPFVDMTSSGVILRSGDVMSVHMTYDGTTLAMTVTDATAGKNFSTSWAVNIPAIVGANTAYVGFTGGTGGLSSTQEIISWNYAIP